MKTIHRGTREFRLENGHLYYNGELVPVRTLWGYTYKINKTCISAHDGAEGLYKFIEECITENFGLVWIDAIENGIKRIITYHNTKGR